ncbi:uncharacterized protein LOC120136510 [Hibiscus syriacus]|uniref:uncharacterized protein LOC120136510 n=1 Tax=Hibiscus syriacus TaxID=106335 RepID=UPI001921AEB9|nr:uncharacterized protein LOC120136510 [Hibiscus syriacus]
MAILNRLPIRDRLLRMGMAIESNRCLLCGNEAESRDHLFFECRFANDLWGSILELCCISRVAGRWDGELAWASLMLKGKSLIVRLLKLAWSGHVYNLWNERNNRLYGSDARSNDAVLEDIKETIRFRLEGKCFNRADPSNNALFFASLGNEN